jgi:hypothetical protein
MRPIILVMLFAQVAILLATIFAVAARRPTTARPIPIWSSLMISLLIVGMASNTIAADHTGSPGADILAFGGPLLIGMGVMAALMLFRDRRSSTANDVR